MESPCFRPFSDYFVQLPGRISSPLAFKAEWKAVMGSPEAKRDKGVVYVWTADKPIPRLKGESTIIYIGKTVNTLHDRHYQYGHVEATGPRNQPRYEHILENYGKITFRVAKKEMFSSGDVKGVERMLLAAYFKDHLEYPPLNRMGK